MVTKALHKLFRLQVEGWVRVGQDPSWVYIIVESQVLEAQNIRLKCLFGELQYIMDILLALCVSKYRHGFDNLIPYSNLVLSKGNSFWVSAQKRVIHCYLVSIKKQAFWGGLSWWYCTLYSKLLAQPVVLSYSRAYLWHHSQRRQSPLNWQSSGWWLYHSVSWNSRLCLLVLNIYATLSGKNK